MADVEQVAREVVLDSGGRPAIWEEAHHPLSEVHRESFKKRVEQLGLTEYLSSWFKAAVRQEKRLIDVTELLEEQNRERRALGRAS